MGSTAPVLYLQLWYFLILKNLAKKDGFKVCASAYPTLGHWKASAFWRVAPRFEKSESAPFREPVHPVSSLESSPMRPRRTSKFKVRPFHFHGAWDGRTPGLVRTTDKCWRTQRTPKNSRAGPARPGCWNSLELLSLLLKLLIAEIIGHQQPNNATIFLFTTLDIVSQLLTPTLTLTYINT